MEKPTIAVYLNEVEIDFIMRKVHEDSKFRKRLENYLEDLKRQVNRV